MGVFRSSQEGFFGIVLGLVFFAPYANDQNVALPKPMVLGGLKSLRCAVGIHKRLMFEDLGALAKRKIQLHLTNSLYRSDLFELESKLWSGVNSFIATGTSPVGIQKADRFSSIALAAIRSFLDEFLGVPFPF